MTTMLTRLAMIIFCGWTPLALPILVHSRRPVPAEQGLRSASARSSEAHDSPSGPGALQDSRSPAALPPELIRLLQQIKAADHELLAVSEEDGRFLRLMVGIERRDPRARDRRRERVQRDLDRPGPAGDRRAADDDRVRPGARALAADNVRRAGLSDIVTVVPGDAFKEIPKLDGDFDFVFVDAWKRDYKRFFDLVFPRLRPRGLFLAHNVVNKTERDARLPRGDSRHIPA